MKMDSRGRVPRERLPLGGPLEEGSDPLIDLLAKSGDLALGDAGHAHGLDQLVHGAGRNALLVGLLSYS